MLNMIVAVIIEVVQEHAKLKADKSANKTAESTAQRLTRIENDLTAIRRKLQIADDG